MANIGRKRPRQDFIDLLFNDVWDYSESGPTGSTADDDVGSQTGLTNTESASSGSSADVACTVPRGMSSASVGTCEVKNMTVVKDRTTSIECLDDTTTELLAMLDEIDDREELALAPHAARSCNTNPQVHNSSASSRTHHNDSSSAAGRTQHSTSAWPCEKSAPSSQELSAMIDPLMPHPSLPAPCGFLEDLQFWEDVNVRLHPARRCSWYDDAFLLQCPVTMGYDDLLRKAADYILTDIACHYQFKIGITESPYARWMNSDFGYILDKKEPWLFMSLLYAHRSSKPHHRESTGNFEKDLIKMFAWDQNCINRIGGGGDCPSSGTPHFCYVVGRALPKSHRACVVETTAVHGM